MIEVDLEFITHESDYQPITTNFVGEELMKIIESLPAGYRTVFNLFAIEGYNHAEIAEMLGISEGTSKSQLSRARVILQEKIRRSDGFSDVRPLND